MTPEDARYAALRKFGNVIRVQENTRAVWIPVWLDQLPPGRSLRASHVAPESRLHHASRS